MMEARILAPNEPAWLDCLQLVDHDIYHLPAYVSLEAKRMGGAARLFVIEEGPRRLILPLVVCPVSVGGDVVQGAVDGRTPYGYPGPLLSGDPDSRWVIDAMDALLGLLDEAAVVAVFVRLHPLLPSPREAMSQKGTLLEHGETVWIDLTASETDLWQQTRATTRNLINRLKRAGLVATMDVAWSNFDTFLEVYRQTMRRSGASEWYFFDRAYFDGLRAALGHRLHLCTVSGDGSVQAAGLFTECCSTVQFHLAGTADEFRAASPSRLMLDYARTWAKARGNLRMHLGGGLGAAHDSLFEFKAGFSKLRASFETWRAVVRPEAYARVVELWERSAGRAADPIDGYFPAYRRALT